MRPKKLVMHHSRLKREKRRVPWSRPGPPGETIIQSTSSITLLATIFAITLALLDGCGGNVRTHYVPSTPTVTATPSRENIIEAVRHSVEGKTHVVTAQRQEPQVHRCDQNDVDRDPYMPHNPELAKCPSVGATYTTWQTVTEHQTQRCEPLPGPEYGWHVQELGDDKWRVSLGGSSWDVQKLSGAAAKGPEQVNVSSFEFSINPHQDC